MKKVVLLGDSIRLIGYGTKVPEMLGPEYTVWQPSDNGRYAQYTLHGVLEDWVDGIAGADIIHWNNGLWDMSVHGDDGVFTPLEAYGDFIMRIAKALKKNDRKDNLRDDDTGQKPSAQQQRDRQKIQRIHRAETRSGRNHYKRPLLARLGKPR